jgi:hypothetical protein
MDIIFGEEKEEETFLNTKYLKYSRFKNGYLEEWIRNKYDLKTDVHSSFAYNEIYVLFISNKNINSNIYLKKKFNQ